MPNNKEFAIDINKWRGKSLAEIQSQFSSVPIEAGKRPLEQRITTLAVSLKDFAKLVKENSQDSTNIATAKIFTWAKETQPTVEIWTKDQNPTQTEILQAMTDYIDFNPTNIMLWFSPGQKGIYDESRIGIYQIINVNSERYLFFRNLCGYQTTEEQDAIARKFLPFSTIKEEFNELSDSEILRSTPIPVSLSGNSLLAFLSSKIDSPKIWQAVRQGKDLKTNAETEKVSQEIVNEEVYHAIQTARTFEQQVRIGQYLERQMEIRLGIQLQEGSCGGLYSSVSLGQTIFSADHNLGNTNKENKKKFKHCGKCMGKTGEFKEGESLCKNAQTS